MAKISQVSRLPFHPYASYQRRYVDHLLNQHGDEIEGKVLDIGAKKRNWSRYENISTRIDSYFALDITTRDQFELDVLADAASLPFDDASFDTIILSEVIEHIPLHRLESVLNETNRVLTEGGKLLLSSPFIYPIHGDSDHLRLTPMGLSTLLENAGYQDVSITKAGSFAEVLLHVLWHPLCFDVVPRLGFGTRHLGWFFVLIHYPVIILSRLPWRFLAKKPPHAVGTDNWYLTTFAVAERGPDAEFNQKVN